MKISTAIAMEIVGELSCIIQHKINLMNEEGIIIASSDEFRVGSKHMASQKILSEKLKSLTVVEDEEYIGSKKGINLPIEIENQYIGVIGISGDYIDVEKYGQVIKKMTEILLMEGDRKTKQQLEQEAKGRFIRDWVINGISIKDKSFIDRAKMYNLDLYKKRNIIVFSTEGIQSVDSKESLRQLEEVEKVIVNIISNEEEALYLSDSQFYLILVLEQSEQKLIQLCTRLQTAIQKSDGHFYFGIDRENVDIFAMQESFMRAEKSMILAKQNNSERPVFYNELFLELFMNEIPEILKCEFIGKVYKGFDSVEIKEMSKILYTLYNCNGSISMASEQLYIHKNTLQYKLNKLHRLTGINPRTTPGSVLFYIANEFIQALD